MANPKRQFSVFFRSEVNPNFLRTYVWNLFELYLVYIVLEVSSKLYVQVNYKICKSFYGRRDGVNFLVIFK